MDLPASWTRNHITHNGKSLISFSYLECEMEDGKFYSYNLKEVIVDSTLELHTSVLEKPLVNSSYINVKKSIDSVSELEDYLRQLNSLKVCQDGVLDQLRSNEVAKNQCDVVQEIQKASHCKTPSGRRYSENWLMLCMLLYMRNLAIINTQCGFDSEFFEAFSNFLNKKEEIYKHGLLLLDEISCRESVDVRSQNLTYVGL
ncbi:hypothetical protein KQX54_013535 [Cotesia glomerata]|uniref:Transposable element P transposase-like RNase H domain-containing protein n=1 Tax=Cotesia glomerata TaxID=32391 RepID=A0AAV7J8A6_COTGL|nr:hypothetical protein KQX54_013535 [Cotesia glomerata]